MFKNEHGSEVSIYFTSDLAQETYQKLFIQLQEFLTKHVLSQDSPPVEAPKENAPTSESVTTKEEGIPNV